MYQYSLIHTTGDTSQQTSSNKKRVTHVELCAHRFCSIFIAVSVINVKCVEQGISTYQQIVCMSVSCNSAYNHFIMVASVLELFLHGTLAALFAVQHNINDATMYNKCMWLTYLLSATRYGCTKVKLVTMRASKPVTLNSFIIVSNG